MNSKRKFYDSITLSLIISNDLSDDTTTSSSLSTYRFKYKRHCLKNVYLVLGGQSLYFLVLALSGSCFKGGDDDARRRPYRYLPTYLHVFIIKGTSFGGWASGLLGGGLVWPGGFGLASFLSVSGRGPLFSSRKRHFQKC